VDYSGEHSMTIMSGIAVYSILSLLLSPLAGSFVRHGLREEPGVAANGEPDPEIPPEQDAVVGSA
jgi:hypothetical protein